MDFTALIMIFFVVILFFVLVALKIRSKKEQKANMLEYMKSQDLMQNTKTILRHDGGKVAIFDNNIKQLEVWSSVDKKRKTFYYSDIVSFELLENGSSTISGGVGSALVGGILFGAVGAIVGASAGSKSVESDCLSLIVKITVNNPIDPVFFITIFEAESYALPTTSPLYKEIFHSAHECISMLQLICESQESKKDRESRGQSENAINPYSETNLSSADEILKFKKLFDDGIITSTEFENKKKQLLGLEIVS